MERVRFLTLNKKISTDELKLLEKNGFGLYSDSFFYDLENNLMLLPVVGKKRPEPSLVREFRNLGIDLQAKDIRFSDHQMVVFKGHGRDLGLTNAEIDTKIHEVLRDSPQLKEKKLLVELNSKDLALHFFL